MADEDTHAPARRKYLTGSVHSLVRFGEIILFPVGELNNDRRMDRMCPGSTFTTNHVKYAQAECKTALTIAHVDPTALIEGFLYKK